MPLLAIVLGVAGLIPFIVCGLGAVSVDAVSSARMMTALIGYGAVILSFLGGVHWGFALRGFALGGIAAAPPAPVTVAGNRFVTAERARLVLGVVPSLIGWVALLLLMIRLDWAALAVLIAGFIATVVVEHQASRRQLIPLGSYIWLRWGLTVVVVAMLVTVLTLRTLGQRM
jgi:hypothetical protein